MAAGTTPGPRAGVLIANYFVRVADYVRAEIVDEMQARDDEGNWCHPRVDLDWITERMGYLVRLHNAGYPGLFETGTMPSPKALLSHLGRSPGA